ncbi:MAG: pyocin knob domain-containing protein [Lactococcus lactis]|uniref:pyocin knob domain-containing protein n=1 Tax=Lactococcus lactis TaxID=1358 RepID=UPI0025A2918B|nr:pyocin knob domain-containing protein [Lactococcus lactis]MDM7656617.1 pyocin knob domain-containing protein [Lactococcus lactis]
MSYEKQTWNKYDELKTEEENIENGAVVTDNRMNHMESGIGDNDANLASHLADKNNPHKVTAAQVGLGNVQNFGLATEDEAKQGISNAKYMTPSLTQAVLSANINSTAYANSADGTDRFTTVYPNLNLLDGTKDFSGLWGYAESWVTDGTYKGLTVKKKTAQWAGIYKTFTAPKDGTYTFSAYVRSSGNMANVYRFVSVNGGNQNIIVPDTPLGNNFDWLRDSFKVTLKASDTIYAKYEITGSGSDSILWTAGHKWEPGSIATPYMPSSSEVTTADWPNYVGFSNTVKTNKSASDYTWFPVKDSELTNKVESHINNKANPHAVTASQVGAYTKTESDSKLTDLSNKVIANKGNLASGTDLDNVIDIGTYRIGGLTGGTDIINVPSERSGTTIYAYLTVSGTTTSVVQELIVYDSKTVSQIYSRSRSGSTPTFSPWSKTVMADDSGKVKVTDLEVSGTIKRINDTDWTSLGNFTSIKREGNTVTVKVVNGTRTTAGDITLGTIPTECRPVDSVMTLVPAWSAGTTNDKHVQLNGSSMAAPGGMTILSAAANTQYTFQFKYEI